MSDTSSSIAEVRFLAAYEEFADAIFRFCALRVSDREVARDLMQETFTKVWEQVAKGAEVSNWRALLFTTARNLIIDHYRRKKSVSLDALEEGGFAAVYHELGAEKEAEVRRATQALKELPEEYRLVLELRFVEGLPPQEIAEMLGVSPNVVSVRIHRGVERLRALINPTDHHA